MNGEYPFCTVDFHDEELPVQVTLRAFTPFIPLNADDSGIPGAYLTYRATNISGKKLLVSIAGSLPNIVGYKGLDAYKSVRVQPGGRSALKDDEGTKGIFFDSATIPPDSLDFGSLCILSQNHDVSQKEKWLAGGWFEGLQDFWDDFSEDGRLAGSVLSNAPGGKLELLNRYPVAGEHLRD